MRPLLKRLHHYFSGYYTNLIVLLSLLFIFRPYDRGLFYLGIWKLGLTVTLLLTLFTCKHHPIVKNLSIVLAIPAILLSWANLIHEEHWVFVGNVTFTILFLTLTASTVVYDVVKKAKVTLETLRGVICAYFMVAILFAYIYYLIEFLIPGSFYLARSVSVFSYVHFLSEMMYFSFVTLLTIGYGDLYPIQGVSQTAAVIEGIIGQFYIAILVSRLVAVYAHAAFESKNHNNLLEEKP
jgi:voltage-gated potassium channel